MAKRRLSKKLHMSRGATHARVQFQEAQHGRDISGKFKDMPGSIVPGQNGVAAPPVSTQPATKADWMAGAKTTKVANTDVIKLHVTSNPKKPGSNSAARFAKYQDGMTVGDFKAAGGRPSDIAWAAREHGFVSFHDPDTYQKIKTSGASPVAQINGDTASGHLKGIKAQYEMKAGAVDDVVKPEPPKIPAKVSGEPPPAPAQPAPPAEPPAKPPAGPAQELQPPAGPNAPPAPKPAPAAPPEAAAVSTFKKGQTLTAEDQTLNGVEMKPWTPPTTKNGWAAVEGQMPDLEEPPFPPGKVSSGILMTEPDGRVWIVKPTNAFGGYQHTFPKGTIESGMGSQANAIKEVFEESGLKARITGFAGDFKGDTGTTRYYHGVREGGTPLDHGWESEAVILAPKNQLGNFVNKQRDKDIVAKHLTDAAEPGVTKPAEPGVQPQPKPPVVEPPPAPKPAPPADLGPDGKPKAPPAPAAPADADMVQLGAGLPKPMPNDHRFKAEELVDMPAGKMIDEGDKGLVWEYEKEYHKYGGNSWVQNKGGVTIKSQEDFNKKYKDAPLTYLTDDQYNGLGYTTVNMKSLPTFAEVSATGGTYGIGHRRDPKAIRERMFNGVTTPPIVLKHGNTLRLMAGQSRIWTGLASGIRVPVKVIDVTPGGPTPMPGVTPKPQPEPFTIPKQPPPTTVAQPNGPQPAGKPAYVPKADFDESDVRWADTSVSLGYKKQFVARLSKLPNKFVNAVMASGRPHVYGKSSNAAAVHGNIKGAEAFYSHSTKRSTFLENKSKSSSKLYADQGVTAEEIEQHHTTVIAHEFGHQMDYAARKTNPANLDQTGGSKDPEFMALAKAVRLKYIATPNKTHSEKWATYFTSNTEMWAAGTEVVMTGGRRHVSDQHSRLGKLMREEGLSDWMEKYYRTSGML